MSDTTYVRLVYVFEDGDRSDLALGLIDRLGMITIEQTAPGQDETVARIVGELNEKEQVFEEALMQPEGTDRAKLTYRPIGRAEPSFLTALKETAKRTYRIDLVFDVSAFSGDSTGLDWPAPTPTESAMPPAEYGAPTAQNGEDDKH